mgnify:CR=1 FL=1
MREYLKFYIDGQWVDPIEPASLDVDNPTTEVVSGRIALGTAADVDRAVKAARKAGNVIARAAFDREKLTIQTKRQNDFVSEVDHAAEAVIIATLKEAYPKHAILAEESGASGTSDHVWIIDPLDGTTNFLHGLPHWAISIALEHKGEIVAAVVFDAAKDEMFTAERGDGAFLNDRRIRVSARRQMTESIFATGVPFGGRGTLPATIRDLGRLMPLTAGVRRWGSASLDLAYVAAGRYDGYWERGTHAWDVAAGTLLVKEAGGFVESIHPDQNPVESGSVVAANPQLFDEFSAVIRQRD